MTALDHRINSDAYDIGFIDPAYVATIRAAIVHEAGHTFGLVHVRTDGGTDNTALTSGSTSDVMSYDSPNAEAQRARTAEYAMIPEESPRRCEVRCSARLVGRPKLARLDPEPDLLALFVCVAKNHGLNRCAQGRIPFDRHNPLIA